MKKSSPRSLAKPKVCEFESRYAKRESKQKKGKHSAGGKGSSKGKSSEAKGKEAEKPSALNAMLSILRQGEDENLERKKTFDVIPEKVSSKIKARKSKSCNKIDDSAEAEGGKKQRFSPTRAMEGQNANLREHSDAKATLNCRAMNDANVPQIELPRKSPSALREQPGAVSEQESPRENRESAGNEEKGEKEVFGEEFLQQELSGKEQPVDRIRAVKERSILSIRGSQHGGQQRKGLLQLQGKAACALSPGSEEVAKEVQKDISVLLNTAPQGEVPDGLSFSCVSTCTFDVTDGSLQRVPSERQSKAGGGQSAQGREESELLEELSSLSSLSVSTVEPQQSGEGERQRVPSQQSWEQDIRQYRAIVKEIMSQYKRIDGFLKQNEHPQSFAGSVGVMPKEEEASSGANEPSRTVREVNIHEYRRKILSEYQALPIFEYKTKLQEEAASRKEEKRRNLTFVRALKTEMDVDVKDFKPNIQKILDSQLYVDMDNLTRRKEHFVRFREKKSSLQEIVLSRAEKKVRDEECLRSNSTPKTFPSVLRDQGAYSTSTQNLHATARDDSAGLKTLMLKL